MKWFGHIEKRDRDDVGERIKKMDLPGRRLRTIHECKEGGHEGC